jgi:hypothetical protein
MNRKPFKIIEGMICIAGLLLTQCRQQPPAVVQTPAATAVPTQTPAPTATPTEGERVAATRASGFINPYIPNAGECQNAVRDGSVTRCVSLNSIKSLSQPQWEQLFPDANFYLITYMAFDEANLISPDPHSPELIVEQDGRNYTARSFDQLLTANNILIADENRELVAQAFALMTLDEYVAEEIIFINWELVDLQRGFSHFDSHLQAWTKLGGLEIEWYLGFKGERLDVAVGPAVINSKTGNYIPLPEGKGNGLVYENYNFQAE